MKKLFKFLPLKVKSPETQDITVPPLIHLTNIYKVPRMKKELLPLNTLNAKTNICQEWFQGKQEVEMSKTRRKYCLIIFLFKKGAKIKWQYKGEEEEWGTKPRTCFIRIGISTLTYKFIKCKY